MATVIGAPAGYVRARMRARYAAAVGLFAGAAVMAVGAAAWTSGWGLLVGLGIAAGVGLAGVPSWQAAGRGRVGVDAERLVGRALARSGQCDVVLNSVLVGGGGDADHIAVGPVLVVVETKAGFGRISVAGGRLRSGRRVITGDPVGQVRRQATALQRLTGLPVSAVVCIANGQGPAQRAGDVVVCSAADLPGVLASAPRRLAPGQVDVVVRAIVTFDEADRARRAARAARGSRTSAGP